MMLVTFSVKNEDTRHLFWYCPNHNNSTSLKKCSIKEQCHNNKLTKEQCHDKKHSYKTTQQRENVTFLLVDPILSISIS